MVDLYIPLLSWKVEILRRFREIYKNVENFSKLKGICIRSALSFALPAVTVYLSKPYSNLAKSCKKSQISQKRRKIEGGRNWVKWVFFNSWFFENVCFPKKFVLIEKKPSCRLRYISCWDHTIRKRKIWRFLWYNFDKPTLWNKNVEGVTYVCVSCSTCRERQEPDWHTYHYLLVLALDRNCSVLPWNILPFGYCESLWDNPSSYRERETFLKNGLYSVLCSLAGLFCCERPQ